MPEAEETAAAAAWMRHVRGGDFEAAWRIGDGLLREPRDATHWTLPRHLQRVWDGSPIRDRRVLVRCYHGLGDTIQFCRYLPRVQRLARELTVWAQAPLMPLLRSMRLPMRLLPLHDGVPEVEYDVDVEVMELPHLFRTTLATIPADVPYLEVAPATPAARAADGSAEGLDVGLVWRAGEWDDRRSMSFEQVAPLATVPGVRLHILQQGGALREHRPGVGVLAGSPDVLEVARRMRALDLVISVDSMPAHLAGALGVPVWTLLHADADWRWMEGRDDTPWYPTMRLFRQERPGDWDRVVARVAAELHARVRHVTRRALEGVIADPPSHGAPGDRVA